MTTSIGKLSKSFLVKVLVGIIILPFVFWGMGDVFRGGNQNVIASIDSKKISTQEFMKYLNRLKLSQDEIKSLPKTNLVEKILSFTSIEVFFPSILNLSIFIYFFFFSGIFFNFSIFSIFSAIVSLRTFLTDSLTTT